MSWKTRVVAVSLLLVAASLAWAQEATPDATAAEPKQPMQWGFYVGYAPGGIVSEATFQDDTPTRGQTSNGGLKPEVEDIKEIGGIWAVALGKRTWFQARLSIGETTYFDTPNGSIDAMMYNIDAALMPRWEWGFYQLGIPIGIGWAQFDADEALASGDVPGANYTLPMKSGGGPTYFFGVYNGFKLGEKWSLFVDIRYKKYHRMTTVTEAGLKTEEYTFGIAREF